MSVSAKMSAVLTFSPSRTSALNGVRVVLRSVGRLGLGRFSSTGFASAGSSALLLRRLDFRLPLVGRFSSAFFPADLLLELGFEDGRLLDAAADLVLVHVGPDLVEDGDLPQDLGVLGVAEAEVLEQPPGDPDEALLQVEVGLVHDVADGLAVLVRQPRRLVLDLLGGQPQLLAEGPGFAGEVGVVGTELEELAVDRDHPVLQPLLAQLVEDGPVDDLELLDLLVRPVDQGQPLQGGQMGLLALQDEAQEADGLLVPVLLDQVVDQGLEELVGLVELVLEDLDPAELDPGVDVERDGR